MNFLHYEMDLSPDDAVEVTLDSQANVRLMDDPNYAKYQKGEQHNYFGGLATASPLTIRAPHSGHWHVVVDLGGYGGTIRAAVRAIKA